MEESDDIHAALALMYGYAAKYAPSTVIEARIDALVVRHFSFQFFMSWPRYSYELMCWGVPRWLEIGINTTLVN